MLPRGIGSENPLSERLDPAAAGGACRIPENASSLALTLQIERSFQQQEASWSRARPSCPGSKSGPLLAARITRAVSPGCSFLVVHPSLRVYFPPAHRKGLVSSSVSAGARLAMVASGKVLRRQRRASASPVSSSPRNQDFLREHFCTCFQHLQGLQSRVIYVSGILCGGGDQETGPCRCALGGTRGAAEALAQALRLTRGLQRGCVV